MNRETIRVVMRFFVLLAPPLIAGCSQGEDPMPDLEKGISLSLARERAALVDGVRYDLRFTLNEGAKLTQGECIVRFTLKRSPDFLVLDFDGSSLGKLSVNDEPVPEPVIVHDHIVIPGRLLEEGKNEVLTRFQSPVGQGGTALTSFKDQSDGGQYLYTLLVPGDAHRLFPCFDQPDLKARLTLKLDMPSHWTAVSNAPIVERVTIPARKTIRFSETEPLSTYLMAFAAGTFVRIDEEGVDGRPSSLYVRRSRKDNVPKEDLFRLNREALVWLEEYFDYPYPFRKLDLVLVPGFPYGGMEHAGAIFYREQSMLFDQTPTEGQLLRRAILIYHEVSHQWFGNLVTMNWFDDLWLKEGFATFVSYRILDALVPEAGAWQRFHQRIKPAAYNVDATAGTTPVFQELSNLDHAKSAYGAIVYNKAPAILRQLEFALGEEAFRGGTRLCVKRFAFRNAGWKEIFRCFEEASGRSLDQWLDAWLLKPGMPKVSGESRESCYGETQGVIQLFHLCQEPVRGSGIVWPLRIEAVLWYPDGRIETVPMESSAPSCRIEAMSGKPAPAFIFLNSGDYGYGRFLLDPPSLKGVRENLGSIEDPFLKDQLVSVLWEMVREASLAPCDYIDTALALLADESDPVTFDIQINRIDAALDYYLGKEQLVEVAPRVESLLLDLIEGEETGGALRLVAFRAFIDLASTEEGFARLEGMLEGGPVPQGIEIFPRDRWNMVARLLSAGIDSGPELFEAEKARGGVDSDRYAFAARAAFPDAAVKDDYFAAYLERTKFPESWIEESLGRFNALDQSAITLPFLPRALEMAEWVKEHRKIFFMPRWLSAFINGHRSRMALAMVKTFLEKRSDLPGDIRLKMLQSLDHLERTVRIREKYTR